MSQNINCESCGGKINHKALSKFMENGVPIGKVSYGEDEHYFTMYWHESQGNVH